LFAQGKTREVARVLADVPPGVVQYTLQVSTREPVAARLKADRELRMWRMVLDAPRFASTAHPAVFLPSHDDVDEILDLFDNHADLPDALVERRLDDGVLLSTGIPRRLPILRRGRRTGAMPVT
jgi:hypothetical protein